LGLLVKEPYRVMKNIIPQNPNIGEVGFPQGKSFKRGRITSGSRVGVRVFVQ
jgi:hypothetical protein